MNCLCALSLQSCLILYDSVDCSPSDSLSTGFSRQEYWSGSSFLSPKDRPDPGIKPESSASLASQADSLLPSHWGSPNKLPIAYTTLNLYDSYGNKTHRAIKRNQVQIHGRTQMTHKLLCWVKEARFKRLPAVWFHLQGILEKAKVSGQKVDQRLSGAGRRRKCWWQRRRKEILMEIFNSLIMVVFTPPLKICQTSHNKKGWVYNM